MRAIWSLTLRSKQQRRCWKLRILLYTPMKLPEGGKIVGQQIILDSYFFYGSIVHDINYQLLLCFLSYTLQLVTFSGFVYSQDLRTKLQNFRGAVSREIHKVENSRRSGSGTDNIYVPPSYAHWHELQFLQSSKRDSNSNF